MIRPQAPFKYAAFFRPSINTGDPSCVLPQYGWPPNGQLLCELLQVEWPPNGQLLCELLQVEWPPIGPPQPCVLLRLCGQRRGGRLPDGVAPGVGPHGVRLLGELVLLATA